MNPPRRFLAPKAQLALLALCAFFLTTAPARAQISCTASMSALNFGSVNPLVSYTTSTATLTYNCTNADSKKTHSARLCFSIGEPAGGQLMPRLMSSGATNKLQFQMYQDSAYATPWTSQLGGSPTSPYQVTLTLAKSASMNSSATLYGQVLAGQNTAIPGSYVDDYASSDTALRINDVSGNTAPSTCGNTGNITFPFTVSATVTKQCVVNAVSDVDLGTVPASATNVANNGNISITCSNTTPYYVGLRPSNNSTVGAGLMSAPAGNTDKVPYQLYQNAGMTTLWGNTATASSAGNGVAGSGTGVAKSHTVYVRAPSADYQPDSYSDTVTVVVNY